MEDYRPALLRVEEVRQETPDVRTLLMKFVDPARGEGFSYRPGQFMQLSVVGEGECTFCFSQSPTRADYIEASIKLSGRVTEEFHSLSEGAVVGLRGPYGNWFDVSALEGKNLVFVAGGIGLAPVRSILNYCLDNRSDFGHLTIIYGARTPADLCYKEEHQAWRDTPDCDVHITVDPPPEDSPLHGWTSHVGFVPTVLENVAPSAKKAVCVTCGPPIMIKFTLATLGRLRFADDDVITTLENRMQCGIGTCGRCNIGRVYVCKDGPVFTRTQLKELPDDF